MCVVQVQLSDLGGWTRAGLCGRPCVCIKRHCTTVLRAFALVCANTFRFPALRACSHTGARRVARVAPRVFPNDTRTHGDLKAHDHRAPSLLVHACACVFACDLVRASAVGLRGRCEGGTGCVRVCGCVSLSVFVSACACVRACARACVWVDRRRCSFVWITRAAVLADPCSA